MREAFRLRAADLGVTLDDFAAVKIGWGDKAESLRAMARELSLGLDSFVFVDDNPVECAAVRQLLPEVTVIEASRAEPWTLVERISGFGLFDALAITEDDRGRNREYKAQTQRAELEQSLGSREEFLASLQIVCTVLDGMGTATIARTLQLIEKTNQFNLTTRRHSRGDLERLAREPGSGVLALRARDCFGDAGVIGVAVCVRRENAISIDTFLLSCRMIGRGIESALLWYIAEQARGAGAERLIGEYAPTAKNRLAADFYPKHGFGAAGENRYELDLTAGLPEKPGWITLEEEPTHVHASA